MPERGPQPPTGEPIRIEHEFDQTLGYDVVEATESMVAAMLERDSVRDYLAEVIEDFESRGLSEETREQTVDQLIESGQFSEDTWKWIVQHGTQKTLSYLGPGRYGSLEDADVSVRRSSEWNLEGRSAIISRGLDQVRARVLEASEKNPHLMNRYFDHLEIPDIMKQWVSRTVMKLDPEETKLGAWLIRGATDEQLVNFLQWHVDKYDKINRDPTNETTYYIEQGRQIHTEGVKKLVEQGYLHPRAGEDTSKDATANIYVGDIFDTIVEGRAGYAIYDNYAVISETVNHDARRTEHTTVHELNHLNTGRIGYRWLNEALTEHIAKSILVGDPDSIMSGLEPPYDHERFLLFRLLNRGVNREPAIPVSKLTQLYSAREGEFDALLEEINHDLALSYFGREDENGGVTLEGVDYPTDILQAIGENILQMEGNLLFHEPKAWEGKPRHAIEVQAVKDATAMLDNNPRRLMTMPQL